MSILARTEYKKFMELILTKNIRPGETTWIEEYEKAGGYSALRKAVSELSPPDLVKIVTDAALRGRGGAGFPTGMKWSTILPLEHSARPRYYVCNLDEMSPERSRIVSSSMATHIN